jgi:SAM-dependent methyltransferase
MVAVNDRYLVDSTALDLMRRAELTDNLMLVACLEEHYHRLLFEAHDARERSTLYGMAYRELSATEEVRKRASHGLHPSIVELVAPWFRGARVLELGCGTGVLAARLGGSTESYFGIDVSASAIDAARGSATHSQVAFACDNIVTADLSKRSFDVIYSNDVLEHLHPEDGNTLLARCRRALRPGGTLIAVTSARLFGPFDVSRRYVPIGQPARGLHLHETSYGDLSMLLSEHGFTRVRSPYLPLRATLPLKRLGVLTRIPMISARTKALAETNRVTRTAFSRLLLLKTIIVFAN